jgi:hypothetical protein
MAMFTAYFDASGNAKDQPLVIVSGYIANHFQWRNFEDLWDRIHVDYGVSKPFHMAEFMAARRSPAYRHQKNARPDYVALAGDEKEADRFLRNLVWAQAMSVLCSISCIVPMSLYAEVDSVLELREVVPPYALGARMCIQRLHRWEDDYKIREPVEYIFESGDFEQGKFTELMIAEGEAVPIYKKKDDFAGLQGADHYAWEEFNFLKRHTVNELQNATPTLGMLLQSIPKLHTSPTIQGLIDICHIKGIDARVK